MRRYSLPKMGKNKYFFQFPLSLAHQRLTLPSVLCLLSSVLTFFESIAQVAPNYRGMPVVPFGSAHHRPCRQLPRSLTIKQRTSSNDQFVSREAYFAASRFTLHAIVLACRKKIIVQICEVKSGTPYGKTTYEKLPPSIQSIWRIIQRNSIAQTTIWRAIR